MTKYISDCDKDGTCRPRRGSTDGYSKSGAAKYAARMLRKRRACSS